MDLFCEIPCLVEKSNVLDGLDLCKKWFPKADRREPEKSLQKFIAYNVHQFEFLGTTPSIEDFKGGSGISFRTSRYIGAIPLRAPDTGKQIGDFVVAPRSVNRERFEDYIEILDLLGQVISPETAGSLPLASGRNFRPPFYLEAVKFIVALEKVLRKPWRKFDCIEVTRSEPSGQVNWEKYVQFENEAASKLSFPVRQNILSEFHREFRQIRYVFDICKKELRSSNVPHRIRNGFRPRLAHIEQRLYLHAPLPSDSLDIKATDRPAVKEAKYQANRILNRQQSKSTAWRVDLNDVFEKFVQHIFERITHSIGGKLAANPRIRSDAAGREMRQIEPAAVLRTRDLTAFIDAKYKSHLFYRAEADDHLNEDLSRDLHQVASYTSSAETPRAISFICYPSDRVEVEVKRSTNPNDGSPCNVLIAGIPLKRSELPEAIAQISSEIDIIRSDSESA